MLQILVVKEVVDDIMSRSHSSTIVPKVFCLFFKSSRL